MPRMRDQEGKRFRSVSIKAVVKCRKGLRLILCSTEDECGKELYCFLGRECVCVFYG